MLNRLDTQDPRLISSSPSSTSISSRSKSLSLSATAVTDETEPITRFRLIPCDTATLSKSPTLNSRSTSAYAESAIELTNKATNNELTNKAINCADVLRILFDLH